jgi:hypothetical protein
MKTSRHSLVASLLMALMAASVPQRPSAAPTTRLPLRPPLPHPRARTISISSKANGACIIA